MTQAQIIPINPINPLDHQEQLKSNLKILVRSAYQLQKLRIQTGNRLCANFAVKLGIKPGEKSEKVLDKEQKTMMDVLRLSYKRITDGIAGKSVNRKNFKEDGLINSLTEFTLVQLYIDMEKSESDQFALLGKTLTEFPIFNQFLAGVKGVGPAMAGVIISEIDIHKAEYPSSIWAYAGLDVVTSDGKGRSRRKEHLVDVEYTDKDGKPSTKKSITFNPFLKTKLMGVLGASFLRSGTKNDSNYANVYYDYKNRLQNRPDLKGESAGHIHNMSIRYMIKRFLVDLYKAWRAIEGLPIAEEYSEAKLGIVHKKAA